MGLAGSMPCCFIFGALYPSKSGLVNKHIVKLVYPVLKQTTCCGSLQGQCFIFGALCPSKSGQVNKHIVKQTATSTPVSTRAEVMYDEMGVRCGGGAKRKWDQCTKLPQT